MCSADRFSPGSGCSSEPCDLYLRVYYAEHKDTSAKQRKNATYSLHVTRNASRKGVT